MARSVTKTCLCSSSSTVAAWGALTAQRRLKRSPPPPGAVKTAPALPPRHERGAGDAAGCRTSAWGPGVQWTLENPSRITTGSSPNLPLLVQCLDKPRHKLILIPSVVPAQCPSPLPNVKCSPASVHTTVWCQPTEAPIDVTFSLASDSTSLGTCSCPSPPWPSLPMNPFPNMKSSPGS